MRYIYDVLIDNVSAVSCSSLRVAKEMIIELSEFNKDSSFGIYNSSTGRIINIINVKENYNMHYF